MFRDALHNHLITKIFVITFLFALFLTSCIASYDYNVEGTWDYTTYAMDGHPVDKGTIYFSGNPMNGTFHMITYDEVEIEGSYTLQDNEIRLTVSENWQGTLSDEDNMSGSWWEDDGTQGTFEAVRVCMIDC
jgi:hypothetical protein